MVGKGENISNSIFFFSHSVSKATKANSMFCVLCALLNADGYVYDKAKTLLCGKELTLYHTIPTFNDPEKEDF